MGERQDGTGYLAMKIRFTRNWRHYREGQEFDFNDGQANVLIQRGLVIEVEQAPASGVQTMVPPAVVEAVQSTVKRFGKRREA